MRKIKKKKNIISLRLKITLLAVVISVLGLVAFLMSPWGKPVVHTVRVGYQTVVEKAHLVLDQVKVEGHARTSLADINDALGLTQGMPIFDIDLKAAQERLSTLPWVREVSVERYLPSVLFIRIVERKPIAVWQHQKTYHPLDESGEPIADDKTILSGLLLVVGDDAPEHTPALIQMLAKYPDVAVKVRSAVRVGSRRWNLILNDAEEGLEVYLPETDVEVALERLQKMNEEEQILRRDLQVIDLRISDRLIVRMHKGGRS